MGLLISTALVLRLRYRKILKFMPKLIRNGLSIDDTIVEKVFNYINANKIAKTSYKSILIMFCWQAPAFFFFFFLSFFCLDTVYTSYFTYYKRSTPCSPSPILFQPWWPPYPYSSPRVHAPGSPFRLSWFIAVMLDHETLKDVFHNVHHLQHYFSPGGRPILALRPGSTPLDLLFDFLGSLP